MKPSHEGMRYQVETFFDKVAGIISIGLISSTAVVLVAWVVVMVTYIVGRGLGKIEWLFVEEFTAYMMVLIGCFALPYTLRSGGHITVDVVTRLLPKRVRGILEVVTNLLSLAIVCYLMYRGYEWFLVGLELGTRSTFPSYMLQWPVYLLIPIGLAALAWALLSRLYGNIISLKKR